MVQDSTLHSIGSDKMHSICNYLGIPLTAWQKSCRLYPELDQLGLKNIRQHVEANSSGLEFDMKEWVSLCQKAPQLYCVNLSTLQQHITENAGVVNVSSEQWVKVCKQEPGLFLYKSDTLKKSLSETPKALGVKPEAWRSACIKRGALFTYKPETLKEKVDAFLMYVKEPKKLLEKIENPSDQTKDTLTRFRGIVLDPGRVIVGFLRHPNNFALTAEKSAAAFAYLYQAVQAYGLRKDPYDLLPYVDLSESNLQLHYLNACLTRHQGRPVTLYALAGAKKKEVRDNLLRVMPNTNQTDEDLIRNFPCPIVRKLKQRQK